MPALLGRLGAIQLDTISVLARSHELVAYPRLPAIVLSVAVWGIGSFENDAASDWFYRVEEAVDPEGLIAAALDDALSDADHLGLEMSCEAIAAAELSASCAGRMPERLPDPVRRWVSANPHQPHGAEIDQAVQAVARVRLEGELRELWDESADDQDMWLAEIDDLIARLQRSAAGDPPTLSP